MILLLKQAAEARHREAMGRAAKHLQDAPVCRQQKEFKVARELMGLETVELRGRFSLEAGQEVLRHRQHVSTTVEE